MPRHPYIRKNHPRYPEQAKLRPMLASIFPNCNVLIAARIMGINKPAAAKIIDGYAWLSRERALLLIEALKKAEYAISEITRLSERERVERRGKSHVLDEASGRWRDERISRGKIRPKKVPDTTDEDEK